MGWLASSIVCDLLITVTLAVQLRSRRNEGFQYINRVLHRTMRMAIETGALTCCAVVIELVLYLTSYSTYWFILVIISGKIYSNSLLASLNARAPMIRMEDSSDEVIWKADDVELVFRKTFGVTSTVGAVRSET